MKKLTLIAASAVLFNVNASDVEIFDETVDFGGMYIGAGIGGEFAKNKVNGVERKGDADPVAANTTRVATFAEQKLNNNRFIGSVVLGAGRQVNKVYFGAEAMLDMGKSKTKAAAETVDVKNGNGEAVADTKLTRNVNVKSSGFKPVLAARLGYVIPSVKTMVYAKAGVAFNKVKGEDNSDALAAAGGAAAIAVRHDPVKNTKASFVAGLGVEKMFCNKFSARLEGDYNFGAKKNVVKKFGKGFTVRALVAYNVKF